MNPYEVLGVKPDAGAGEIKSAYRKKAQETHPDRISGCADAFAEVAEAYDILSDPGRRRMFDDCGSTEKVKAPDVDSLIAGLFISLIESGNYQGDIIERCQDVIVKSTAENNAKIMQLGSKKLSLEGQLGRIERTGGVNIYDSLLSQRIASINIQLTALEQQKEELAIIATGLKDYTDSKAQPVSRTGAWTSSSTTW